MVLGASTFVLILHFVTYAGGGTSIVPDFLTADDCNAFAKLIKSADNDIARLHDWECVEVNPKARPY